MTVFELYSEPGKWVHFDYSYC